MRTVVAFAIPMQDRQIVCLTVDTSPFKSLLCSLSYFREPREDFNELFTIQMFS